MRKANLWLAVVITAGAFLIAARLYGINIVRDAKEVRSLPWSTYICIPYKWPFAEEIRPGHLVAFVTDRRVLPYYSPGAVFGKRVVGVPGDRLEVRGDEFYINGHFVARARETDSWGNPVKPFSYNGTIPPDSYFVIGLHPKSFDSRYWGFVKREQIICRLFPIGKRSY